MAFGLLLLPARHAEAQGFWRWLEELSGPELSGPGFEVVFVCHSETQVDNKNVFISPQCAAADRSKRWISIGAQVYALAGDNNLTADPDDRVDVFGVLPVVDVNFPQGFAVGGGLGVRRYAAAGGKFSKPDVEAWVRWRPLVTLLDKEVGTRTTVSTRYEALEIRLAFVFHGGFDADRFGPGTRALDAEVSPVLFIGVNLLR
jgi:hypothetical protein